MAASTADRFDLLGALVEYIPYSVKASQQIYQGIMVMLIPSGTAGDELVPAADTSGGRVVGLLEGLEHAVVHGLQVDDRKTGAMLAQRLGIEQGHVLADHAALLQLLDALDEVARRVGQLLQRSTAR